MWEFSSGKRLDGPLPRRPKAQDLRRQDLLNFVQADAGYAILRTGGDEVVAQQWGGNLQGCNFSLQAFNIRLFGPDQVINSRHSSISLRRAFCSPQPNSVSKIVHNTKVPPPTKPPELVPGMVRMALQDGKSAVKLLEKDDTSKLVRKRHLAEREAGRGSFAGFRTKTVSATDGEQNRH